MSPGFSLKMFPTVASQIDLRRSILPQERQQRQVQRSAGTLENNLHASFPPHCTTRGWDRIALQVAGLSCPVFRLSR